MKKTLLVISFCVWFAFAFVTGSVLIFSAAAIYLSPTLPPVETLRDVQLQTPLRVHTRDGKLIAEFGLKRRDPIAFDAIPPLYIQAILAAEDDSFFTHYGISITALLRAALEIATTGSIRTGGSTITMQVAKNFFLSPERAFKRKFNEILLAMQIERELSKSEIMELYVNKIFLGHRAYGISAAANVYYGREIDQLTVAELAMLAGLPKAPSRDNPISNPARAVERRNWILKRMRSLDFIDQATYAQAVQAPISATKYGMQSEVSAPYLAEMVRTEMQSKYGSAAFTEGYSVTTTLDSKAQLAANRALRDGLLNYDMRHGYRGPEGTVAREFVGATESAQLKELDPQSNKAEWLMGLDAYVPHDELKPAIVFAVEEAKGSVWLSNGDVVELLLEDMAWARRFDSVNIRGPVPKTVAEVLAIGDIVRVKQISIKPDAKGKAGDLPALDASELGASDTSINPQPKRHFVLSQLPLAQSALVSLVPKNGAVRALIGGFDFQLSKFNRAVQGGRQVGSGLKPFVYAAGIHKGFTAAKIINDAPLVIADKKLESTWRPENSGRKFYGPTRLRQALYKSRNLVSIRLLQELGIPSAVNYLSRFGFPSAKLPKELTLALGNASLTPLELTTGYASFANGGFKIEPYFIESISNSNGRVLFKANPAVACLSCEIEAQNEQNAMADLSENERETQRMAEQAYAAELNAVDQTEIAVDEQYTVGPDGTVVISPKPIIAPRIMDRRDHFIIQSILQDVITKGTGRKALALRRNDIGGKTGTTNDQKDAWFSGYNQDLVTTVWVGLDDFTSLGNREYGAIAALPIWLDYMKVGLNGSSQKQFKQPPGLVSVRIDPTTGERAAPGQPSIFEIFRTEQVPSYSSERAIGEAKPTTTAPVQERALEQLF